jgi:hypothetical protein
VTTPYNPDPREWLDMEWIDQYTGKRFRVTMTGHDGSRQTVRVKTYGDILAEYEFHPEASVLIPLAVFRKGKPRALGTAARQDRPNQMHWQGIG